MFGCCYCAMESFRFKTEEVDPKRLEKVLKRIKESNLEDHEKNEIEKDVLTCNCLCHVDGYTVMC